MKKSSLPPGLRARKSATGRTFYYLRTSGPREIPLGPDKGEALHVWRAYKLDPYRSGQSTMSPATLLQCFRICEIPLRETDARPALIRQVAILERYFIDCAYNDVTRLPDASVYLAHRGTRHSLRGSAEIRLFIHVWAWGNKHSLIARPDCPWKSDIVLALINQVRMRELEDALRFYANNSDIPDRTRVSNSAYDLSQRQTGSFADNPNSISLIANAARQLTRDDRPDLARSLAQLTIEQTRSVLEAIRHPRGSPSTELILGTCRRQKLEALKGKLADKKRRRQDT